MIPRHFVRISKIPLNPNGKVDKLRLPEPDADGISDTYEEPGTDIQRTLCEAFETVLECTRKVGINDDFFELGGDSVTAMMVIMKCQLKGLCVQNIYEGKTAKGIETLLKTTGLKDETISDPKVPFVQVNASQDYLLRVQSQNPDTTVLNLPIRFRFDPSVDLDRMADAVKKAILLHPSLCSTIEETEEGFLQRFDSDVSLEIVPEKMSAEELELVAKDFVKPFRFDNTPMFRCRLIETQESKEGLLDICHAVCDGESYHKLLEDIGKIYGDEPAERDEYIAICVEEEKFRSSDTFKEEMDYFKRRYDRTGCITLPTPDHNNRENVDAESVLDFPFKRDDVKKISDMYGLGKNGLYIAAAALALASDRDNGNVAFTWTWNGRSDIRRMNSVGCFIKDLPVAYSLEEGLSVERFLNEVSAQIRDGIAHGRVSYWEETGSYYGEDLLCLIFQGDIWDYGESNDIVSAVYELPSEQTACNNKMNLEILDSRDEFAVMVRYDAGVYERSTAEAFADLFCRACSELINIVDHSVSVNELLNL